MVKHTIFLGSYTSGRGPNPQTNYMSEMIKDFGASSSEGIYSATFDDADGSLSNLRLAAEVGVSPAWLQWHPHQPVFYSANETFHYGGIRYTLAQPGLLGTARCQSSTHATPRFLRTPLVVLSPASASPQATVWNASARCKLELAQRATAPYISPASGSRSHITDFRQATPTVSAARSRSSSWRKTGRRSSAWRSWYIRPRRIPNCSATRGGRTGRLTRIPPTLTPPESGFSCVRSDTIPILCIA